MKTSPGFPALLESFFVDHLLGQRRASPHTVQSYHDTFRLLLAFAQQSLKKAPAALALDDLDAPVIGAFLDHIEKKRANSPRTRNARLAAIHSFFQYAALRALDHSPVIQRVLAMQGKKYDRSLVHFLSRPEIDALLEARGCPSGSGGLPCFKSPLAYVLRPLPGRAGRSSRVGLSDRPRRPSSNERRLGARIQPFEACSGFTRVAARTHAPHPWWISGSGALAGRSPFPSPG